MTDTKEARRAGESDIVRFLDWSESLRRSVLQGNQSQIQIQSLSMLYSKLVFDVNTTIVWENSFRQRGMSIVEKSIIQ
jgi:hypothetical protein